MPQQSRFGKPWALLGVTPVVAMLLSCAPPIGDESIVEAKPPSAVAPSDPGVDPPEVRLLDSASPPLPVEARPQGQLVDWSASMSNQLNIPKTALQAYGYAARAADVAMPECGLGWPLLAGIGAIESSHGRYAGSSLDETGRPSVVIRGLPLDGTDGVKKIPDTDNGVVDGDPQFDRAMGPLQFIPSTWQEWGQDADGDGVADPNDLDDAAMTAATYLCSAGGDLRQPDLFWKALLKYNKSRGYGQDVLDHADQYGRKSRDVAVKW